MASLAYSLLDTLSPKAKNASARLKSVMLVGPVCSFFALGISTSRVRRQVTLGNWQQVDLGGCFPQTVGLNLSSFLHLQRLNVFEPRLLTKTMELIETTVCAPCLFSLTCVSFLLHQRAPWAEACSGHLSQAQPNHRTIVAATFNYQYHLTTKGLPLWQFPNFTKKRLLSSTDI